jgi:cellobiose phosphorylase
MEAHLQKIEQGNFSEDGKEFILNNPLLERPWMNVLSNGHWCYVASHLGGGYSFIDQPNVGRITRWHVDGVPRDTVGKFLYVRDEEDGAWWNANGYPPIEPLDDWKCHIGLGYNRIVSQHKGIEAEQTWFTPMPDASKTGTFEVGDACLLWTVKLTNRSDRKRTVSATSYAELAPGNWFEDTSWREFYTLMQRQEFKSNTLYNRSTLWVKYTGGWQAQNSDSNNIPFKYAIFLNSSAPVASYEGDRYQFMGAYRDLKSPQAMELADLRNVAAVGRDACAALRSRFELAPGETAEYVLVLGVVDQESIDAAALYEKYNTPAKAAAAFKNLKAYWASVVSSPMVKTPDADLDLMVNTWFKYQGAILSWWNRNTGYCYSGIYNYGVRDACQDAVSRLSQDPEWVRGLILKKIMIWQFDDGDYAHNGNFLSMFGARTFHSDDPLNPLFVVANYCRETGDFSILDEKTPWVNPMTGISGQSEKPDASIYEHLIAGVEFFWSQFSTRGLPLILKADWNDALDQCGKTPQLDARKNIISGTSGQAESVMLAGWACICLEMFYECMAKTGDLERMDRYKQQIEKLKETVNQLCWDGDWYWRATHHSGWILGTKDQLETGGALFGNPNSFAVIAGIADEKRTEKIMSSFEQYLDTPYGSRCFYPPYAEPERRAGIISRFAPGTKENGSLQGHNSRWRIWAECVAGRGDKAYEIMRQMLPNVRWAEDAENYMIEPYAACQFIYAPQTDHPGEGSHSWATGTACWTLLNVWEHLFGIRPLQEGLLVDPCLPSHWESASMTRKFRGSEYVIRISKPKGICKGIVHLTLNGSPVGGDVIPVQKPGGVYHVEVRIMPVHEKKMVAEEVC